MRNLDHGSRGDSAIGDLKRQCRRQSVESSGVIAKRGKVTFHVRHDFTGGFSALRVDIIALINRRPAATAGGRNWPFRVRLLNRHLAATASPGPISTAATAPVAGKYRTTDAD